MKNLKIGVSPLSNRIYAGYTRIDKNGFEVWREKQNVTKEVLTATLEYLIKELKEKDGDFLQLKHSNLSYVLELRREGEE